MNLEIHLNGMCLYTVDNYTDNIHLFEQSIEKQARKTFIKELVIDLVATIKPDTPPLPDMSDPMIFKFYFLMNNKEYK